MRRRLRLLIRKTRGTHEPPPQPPLAESIYALLGGVLAMLLLAWLSRLAGNSLIIAPFGATTVLLFAAPESPLAQPRSVIGGHILATVVGLSVHAAFGPSLWAMGIAVGLAIGLMSITRTVHPPAGADPILIFLAPPAWSFVLTPVATGAVALVLLALVFNNLSRRRRYPRFW